MGNRGEAIGQYILLACFAALLIVGGVRHDSNAQSPPETPKIESPTQQPKQSGGPEQRGTEAVPLVVKAISGYETDAEKNEAAKERKDHANNERNLTDYTGWLAAFTLLLVIVAAAQVGLFVWQLLLIRDAQGEAKKATELVAKQVDELIKQTKIQREEFLSSHRPKIKIRYIAFPAPSYNAIPVAEIRAANVGESDAKILELGVDIFTYIPTEPEKTVFDARPESMSEEVIVMPGKEAAIGIKAKRGVYSSEEVSKIQRKELQLRIVGIITYTDSTGIQRSSSFSRIYDPDIRRFRRVDENDQYAEWDYED
ncbi:MAG TPA: hypothetical protein VGG27_20265 [Magnetospirillaceae bacterium]|jgi:hypothetical protein